jgi:hypothetical protein
MKRLFILIVLLGLVNVFTGCQEQSSPDSTMSTNRVPLPPMAPGTNVGK